MNLSTLQPQRRTWLSVLVSVLVTVSAGLSADQPLYGQTHTVQVVTPKRGDLNKTVELPATVKAWQSAELFGKVGGYLKELNVDIGDHVTEDQVLAVVDVPELQATLLQKLAQVKQAEADVRQADAAVVQANAILQGHEAIVSEAETNLRQKQALMKFEEADFERIRSLVERGAVNRELRDAAEYKVASAKAEIEEARAHVITVQAELAGKQAAVVRAEADVESAIARISVAKANEDVAREMVKYAEIKAPFDGVVTKRWFDPGAFIQSADGNSAARPILQVVRIDKVRVSIMVSMSQVSSLDVGDPVILNNIDGLEGKTFAGVISRMSAGVDEKSRMMEAECDIDNSKGSLMPGYFGYAKVTLVEAKNQLLIPVNSVVFAHLDYVFVVEGGKAVQKMVELSESDGKQVAIANGISANDQVIQNPSGITDGQAVTVK